MRLYIEWGDAELVCDWLIDLSIQIKELYMELLNALSHYYTKLL